MARKLRYKRRSRRPAYKRRRNTKRKRIRRVKRAVGVSRILPGFPNNKLVVLRYGDQFISGAGSNNWNNTFRCNSIFDPDYTNVGHQPLGHDQWSQFYNHYIVIGARIKCKFIRSVGGDTASPASYVTLQLHDSATYINPSTSYTSMLENGLIKHRLWSPSFSTTYLSMGYSPKKFFNVKDLKDNIVRLGAAFGANPTEEAFWTVTYNSLDIAAAANQVRVIVQIDYICMFSEPRDLPGS